MIGNSDTVNASGGDVVSVGRTNEGIGTTSSILDLNSSASATLAGSSDTINAGQGNATVDVAGTNDSTQFGADAVGHTLAHHTSSNHLSGMCKGAGR